MKTTNYELATFPGPGELAETAAREWLEDIERAATGGAPYCVALSGGRIARQFYSAAAGLARARGAKLEQVHFFWGDERCVPPSDPESNFGIAQELLFAPLKISPRRIHRVRGEVAPGLAATEAAAEICRIAPHDATGQPALDLIFLGMGEDGHVASLFPGESEAVMSSRAVYRTVNAVKPPPQRITLGYPAIAAARQVWVLASGAGKETALRESLAPTGKTPLARVLTLRTRTRILTDIVLS
jgi:6-phosphogluconolactonase